MTLLVRTWRDVTDYENKQMVSWCRNVVLLMHQSFVCYNCLTIEEHKSPLICTVMFPSLKRQ